MSSEEGQAFASRRGLMFFEVSSLSGDGIRAMFWSLLSAIVEDLPGASDDMREKTAQHALLVSHEGHIENLFEFVD